jgi:hypothetical protein
MFLAGRENVPAGTRDVEDGRFLGRFTPTGRRADIAKNVARLQCGKGMECLIPGRAEGANPDARAPE